MNSSDRALIEKWTTRRDADAFAEIVSRYSRMVYATCLRILRNGSEAEEVAQECFLKLATGSTVIRSSLGGWLHKLATDRSLNRATSDKRRQVRERKFAENAAASGEASWDDIQSHVDEAIAALPEKIREPVIKHFLEGQTYDELAKTLGIPRSTAASRVQKGLEMVRKSLKKRGIPISAAGLAALMAANTSHAAPASLVAALGKLAVAGTAGSGASVAGAVLTAAGAAKLLGGLSVTKAVAIVTAVILVGGVGTWVMKQKQHARQVTGTVVVEPEPVGEEDTTVGHTQPPVEEAAPLNENPSSQGLLGIEPASPRLAAISGRVFVSETGEALSGARLIAHGPEQIELLSGGDGTYILEALEPGDYTLTCWAPEGVVRTWLSKNVSLADGKWVENVDFSFERGIELSGRVADKAMEPIEGAQLKAESRSSFPWVSSETETDSEGRYVFLVKQNASFHVAVSKQGYGSIISDVIEIPVVEHVIGVDFALEPEAVISGYAVNSDGLPVANSAVHVNTERYYRRHHQPHWLPQGATDHQGKFEIRGVPSGPQYFSVKYENVWRPAISEPVTVRAGQRVQGVEVLVEAKREYEGFIQGFVRNAAGLGIPGVSIQTSGLKKEHHQLVETDDSGHFVMEGLPEGEVGIRFRHHEYATMQLRAVAVGTADLKVVMDPRGSIAGKVVDADTGSPVNDFIISRGRGSVEQKAYHSESGAFVFPNVEPGTVTFEVWAEGYARQEVSGIAVESGKTTGGILVELSLGTTLRGVVVADLDSRPLGGANIYLGDVPRSLQKRQQVAAVTDADGVFVLEGLSTGPHELGVLHSDFAPERVKVDAQGKEVEITIRLQQAGIVEGYVTCDGVPIAEAPIGLLTSMSSMRPGFRRPYDVTRTHDDGRYELKQLPAGIYEVDAGDKVGSFEPGDITRRRSVTVDVQPGRVTQVDLEFTTGNCTIEGYVTSDGQPLPLDRFTSICVKPVSDGAWCHTNLDEDGFYSIDGLLPGAYKVYYMSSGEESAVTVEAGEGETVRQDIELAD